MLPTYNAREAVSELLNPFLAHVTFSYKQTQWLDPKNALKSPDDLLFYWHVN